MRIRRWWDLEEVIDDVVGRCRRPDLVPARLEATREEYRSETSGARGQNVAVDLISDHKYGTCRPA